MAMYNQASSNKRQKIKEPVKGVDTNDNFSGKILLSLFRNNRLFLNTMKTIIDLWFKISVTDKISLLLISDVSVQMNFSVLIDKWFSFKKSIITLIK